MKRYSWLICVLCALCIWTAGFTGGWTPGIAVPAAIAEEDARNQLEISIQAKPDELVAPGDVMLSFTIENISDEPAQNVYLSSSDGLLSEPVGQLAAGEEQSFNRQHSVTQEELDNGLVSYIISHDDPFDPDGKVNYTVHAEIRRSDVLPQVEFTRRFSSLRVEEGGQLTVTYHIRNTGNVTLLNLRVQDELGDYTGRIDRLESGESGSLISRAVIDGPAVSAAVLDYNAEGVDDVLFTQPLDAREISIAETAWEAGLTASVSAFSNDTAEVLLTITNTGSADIRDIAVTDERYGGVIADHLLLLAGESIEVSRSYPLRDTMQFRWKISGVSETGKNVSLYAESRAVAAVEGEAQPLSLTVSTDTPRIRRSGNVDVTVRVSNPGGQDVRDILLCENTLGEIYTFAVIDAGGSAERTLSFDIRENTSYHFSISYDGQSISAAPLEIVMASDGILPEGATNSFIEFTGSSIKVGGSSIFAALLISGLVVLLVLIVLLLIASRRARIEKQLRIAAEKQRRRSETAKNPRSAKSKTKGR